MIYQAHYWPVLIAHISSSSAPVKSTVKLESLGFEQLSPVPLEAQIIPMTGDVPLSIFMDLVVKNFYSLRIRLRYSTWNKLRDIFDMVNTTNFGTAGQKGMEILLIISKLSAVEFYDILTKMINPAPDPSVSTGSDEMPDDQQMDKVSQVFDHALIDSYVIPGLRSMLADNSLFVVDDGVASVIKAFLCLPVILLALRDSLDMVGLAKGIDWMIDAIDNMTIWSCESFESFNGFTVRDGIMICTTSPNYHLLDLKSMDPGNTKNKAHILTIACHESSHYLARLAAGNYNYSSPFPNGLNGDHLLDSVDDKKSLELGRHMEVLLFGGIQPKWSLSSRQAAIDFLDNAISNESYPIITLNPTDPDYLRERSSRSLSFAADVDLELFLSSFIRS